jgi:hypothetical protein
MIKQWILLVTLAIVMAGCDSDDDKIDPDNIFIRMQVQYVSDIENTYIRAIFLEETIAGRNIQLKGGADIMADGVKLTNSDGDPYGYTATLQGYRDTINVVYTDREGNIYDNPVAMSEVPAISFPGGFNNLDIQQDHEMHWSGSPITRDAEKVSLEYGKTGMRFFTATADEVDDNSVTLTSKDLMTLGAGESEMILYRELNKTLPNTPRAGGALSVSFNTGIVPVNLVFDN